MLSRAGLTFACAVGAALTFTVSAAAQTATKGLVDEARLLAANDTTDADWITFGQDYRNQRFSALAGIDRTNVGKLLPAWIYQLATVGSTQVQPLVVDGVMYVTAPNCDIIAINAGTGAEVWRYRYKFVTPRAASNRGAAIGYGKVFEATDDHHVVAVNQATGELIWDKNIGGFVPPSSLGLSGKLMPPPANFSFRYPPVVYDGKVFVATTSTSGNTGNMDDFIKTVTANGWDAGLEWIQLNLGARGFMVALDAATGNEVWRFYFTPENGWEGDYATVAANGTKLVDRDIAKEKAVAPVYKNAWAAGGIAGAWAPAVDPGTGTLYIGTGNPSGPFDMARPGDNLYSNGILALDAKTGKLKWFFQAVPHGTDSDLITQAALFDVTVNGRTVPAVGSGGKDGYYYAVDRSNGKLLFASDPLVPMSNLYRLATPEGILHQPGEPGGVSVSPHSIDPNTNIAYIAEIHRPTTYKANVLPSVIGRPPLMYPTLTTAPPAQAYGLLTAVDLNKNGKVVWQTKTAEPLVGGVVATKGGLVFAGEANGNFNAYDSVNGTKLWGFQTGANVGSSVVTYSVDGRQYVAVATGAAAPADGVALAPGALRPGGAVIAFAVPK